MQNEPFLIEKTVREHTAKLMRESAEKLELCGRLQALDPAKLRDIVDLADELSEPRTNVAPLKGPTFAEFCEQGGFCEDESLFQEEDRLVRRGQIFARCFCPYFVLAAIISSVLSGSMGGFVLSLGLNLLFLIFFLKGYPWARVVLAVLQLFAFFGDLRAIMVTDYDMVSAGGWWLLLILIPVLIAEAACCYFLAFDKGVSAYQYEKRTGGDSYL